MKIIHQLRGAHWAFSEKYNIIERLIIDMNSMKQHDGITLE